MNFNFGKKMSIVHQKSEMTEKQYLFVCFFRAVVVVCCLNWITK